MRRAGRILLLAICTASFGAPASALLIDNFSSPDDYSFSAGSAWVSSTTQYLDPADTLGGARGWSLKANGSGEMAYFSFPEGGGSADLTAGVSGGILRLRYGQDASGAPTILLPFDLTEGGTLNRFEVDLSAVSVTGLLEVGVRQDSDGANFFASVAVSAPGLVSIPYSSFSGSPDFTDIDLISFEFSTESTGTIEFTEFRAVPEPSVASLMAVGLLSLAAWRATSRGDPE